ncbi:MAG TPA: glycoside hydrolase family 16 protein [Candidatus Limnocylindrales bacterium]|nr:glycoside hydrolase family 16 protein [Candidatus Limnocylindrales bacterium]
MNRQAVWGDLCQRLAGTPPDPELWELRVTDKWQPDSELQTYTAAVENACYDGHGNLAITVIRGGGGRFTSARLRARHPGFLYGRFEASIKVADGSGIWPAFWLLGPDYRDGWPSCGEIDIMEAPASPATRGQIHQGIHCARDRDGGDVAVGVSPSSGEWASEFHAYAIDWRQGRIDFYLDQRHTGTVTREQVAARDGDWPFDDKLHTPVLNVAVGGWAGRPGSGWTTQTTLIERVVISQ